MTGDRLNSSELTSSELTEITDNPYKKDFPLLAQNPEIAYLDSAATSQRPSAVIEAQKHFYEAINANALRGLYRLSVDATAAIEDARKALARFIGAVDADGTPRNHSISWHQALGVLCSNPAMTLSFPSWSITPTSSPGSKFVLKPVPALSICV